jgi:hypothetical protein
MHTNIGVVQAEVEAKLGQTQIIVELPNSKYAPI